MVFEKFLKKNLDLKILSLIVAAFLWIFVHLTQSASGFGKSETTLQVPLVVENIAPDLQVVESEGSISITFKGVHRNVEGLKPSDFKASVDVEGKGPGAFQNLPVHVASPVETVVTDTRPSRVEVVLDEEADKTVPVTWEFEGNKNPEKISVIPREVVIKGSKSLVEKVTAAQIRIPEWESIPAIREDYVPMPVDVLSRPVAGLSVIPKTVRVITKFSEAARPIPIRPNIVGTLSIGMELKNVSINPLVVLMDPGKETPYPDHLNTFPIDVTDKQGTLRQTVKLEIPPGVKIYGKSEVNVTLLIAKRS